MPRPGKEKQRISVSGSVLPEISAELDAIAIKEDRTKSQIIERLLLRGLAAYSRDGVLVEAGGWQELRIGEVVITEAQNYLMSDPQGATAGTRKKPPSIQKDIADAKARARTMKRS